MIASVVLPVPEVPRRSRPQIVALNLRPQRLAGSDEMLLTNELIERARPHPVGEGIAAVASIGGARNGLK
jgi:hypothetical protein